MSQVSPPQSIAVGQATTISPPSPTPWGAVVIQNLSPYLVQVQAGTASEWLAPFTSDVFAPGQTNAPVVLTPAGIAGAAASTLGGAQIQATWYDPTEAAMIVGTYPAALPGSAVLAASAPPGLVFGPTVVNLSGGSATFDVPAPSTTRSLIVEVANPPAVPTNVAVFGGQSDLVYRSGPPYLENILGTNTYVVVVPVEGAADSSYTIRVDAAGGPATFTARVWADSVPTQESAFYNGSVQAASVAASNANANIVTGPVRLLTAYVEAGTGVAGAAQLQIGTATIARCDVTAAANAAVTAVVTFPPNTILPANTTLRLSATLLTGTAGATWAYP